MLSGTGTVKRTHEGKQAFSDQSQCAACIVVKVMFFDAHNAAEAVDCEYAFMNYFPSKIGSAMFIMAHNSVL